MKITISTHNISAANRHIQALGRLFGKDVLILTRFTTFCAAQKKRQIAKRAIIAMVNCREHLLTSGRKSFSLACKRNWPLKRCQTVSLSTVILAGIV